MDPKHWSWYLMMLLVPLMALVAVMSIVSMMAVMTGLEDGDLCGTHDVVNAM